MTALELLKAEIDDAGYQLTKTMEGLDDVGAEHKATPDSMSAKEMIEHLAEAYVALSTEVAGGKHSWGTYKAADPTWVGVQSEWKSARDKAADAALGAGTDAAIMLAHDFIVAHDYYHVGQMVTLRLSLDPQFNFYGIYQH